MKDSRRSQCGRSHKAINPDPGQVRANRWTLVPGNTTPALCDLGAGTTARPEQREDAADGQGVRKTKQFNSTILGERKRASQKR